MLLAAKIIQMSNHAQIDLETSNRNLKISLRFISKYNPYDLQLLLTVGTKIIKTLWFLRAYRNSILSEAFFSLFDGFHCLEQNNTHLHLIDDLPPENGKYICQHYAFHCLSNKQGAERTNRK
jgi:hypothetical protein